MGQEESNKEDSKGDKESDSGLQSFASMVRNESFEQWLDRKEKKRHDDIQPRAINRSGLHRRSQKPLKKTELAKISKKQKKKVSSYAKATASHYSKEENQYCFLCKCTSNLSIHHKSKRGKNIDNESEFVTLCLVGGYMDSLYPESNHSHSGGCHGWVEGNKSIARKLGLIND